MNYQSKFGKKSILPKYVFLTTILFFSVLLFSAVQAQEINVSGTITGALDGQPLPGVSIVDVNDAAKGAVTDFDGNYTSESENRSAKSGSICVLCNVTSTCQG